MPMKMNMITTRSFKHDDQNSSSAKPSVPNMQAMTTNLMGTRLSVPEELTDNQVKDSNPLRDRQAIVPIIHRRHRDSDLERKRCSPL